MRSTSLFCSLPFVLAAQPTGATVDRDDRVAVTHPSAQFLPIGVVKGGKAIAYATGFLVSDCHVLTVKHAAGRVAAVAGRRMTFRLPSAGTEGLSAGSVVAAGTLDLVADPNRLDRSEDWLLLRLDRCLGARFGYLALGGQAEGSSPFRTSYGQALYSAGFPFDRSWRRQLTVDPQCRVRRETGRLLYHDCISFAGNSGSPIFATRWRDGRAVVEVTAMQSTAAVTNRALPFHAADGGVATRMMDVIPAIRGHLAKTLGSSTALGVPAGSRGAIRSRTSSPTAH